ncbi:MAG: SEC-C metal-binding domain-containing protein [Verrucomicrobiota bacterium]
MPANPASGGWPPADWAGLPEESPAGAVGPEETLPPSVRPQAKVGRNDPCPCGSQQKYERCCGA